MKWGTVPHSPTRTRGPRTMARTGKLSAVEVTKAKGPAVLHDGGGVGLEQQSRRGGAGSIRLQFFGHPAQPALYGGSEPAMGSLLHLVGDLADQEIAAGRRHRLAAP